MKSTYGESQAYLRELNEEIFSPLSALATGEKLDAICADHNSVVVRELEEYFDKGLQNLAWAQGYLMSRGATGCGDSGHEAAVEYANKTLKKIRKAMGYTVP